MQYKLHINEFIADISIKSQDGKTTAEGVFAINITHRLNSEEKYSYLEVELTPTENIKMMEDDEKPKVDSNPNKKKKLTLLGTIIMEKQENSENSEYTEKQLAIKEGIEKSKFGETKIDQSMINYPKEEQSNSESIFVGMHKTSNNEDQSSVMMNSNIAMQKRYYAFEEALKRKAGFYQIIILTVVWFLTVILSTSFFYFLGTQYIQRGEIFNSRTQLSKYYINHGYEIYKMYNRILRKVALVEGLIEEDR